MDIITKNECNEKRKAENGHKNQDVVRESQEHSLSVGIDAKEAEHHEQQWKLKQTIEGHCLDHREDE